MCRYEVASSMRCCSVDEKHAFSDPLSAARAACVSSPPKLRPTSCHTWEWCYHVRHTVSPLRTAHCGQRSVVCTPQLSSMEILPCRHTACPARPYLHLPTTTKSAAFANSGRTSVISPARCASLLSHQAHQRNQICCEAQVDRDANSP